MDASNDVTVFGDDLGAAAIDPLKRVFVPIEKRTAKGTLVFKTHDQQIYVRLEDGSIRRADRKVRGKAARRADKIARRTSQRTKV